MPQSFAVIGTPIAHSLSPVIHGIFAEQTGIDLTYARILGDALDFEQQVLDFFAQGGAGLNVTVPYKERAFALAQVHSARCTQAGAANTLWMRDGLLHADNTDGVGFIRDVQRHLDVQHKQVLLLGAGGAARGIIGPIHEAGVARLVLANRTQARAQALKVVFPYLKCMTWEALNGSFDLVINATNTSLTGHALSVPEDVYKSKPLCYDLAYSLHASTPFMDDARHYGCAARDGLGMLVEQAAEAFFIWHGLFPKTQAAIQRVRA